MKSSKNNLLALFLVALMASSCRNDVADSAVTKETKPEEDAVELSPAQAELIGLQTGRLELRSLSATVRVNGMLDVPPQNLVSISAPLGGFVKSTELLQGMKINKGQVVAVIQHQDYIQLQQDYLATRSQLDFLQADYRRQQELAGENVNSQKTLQQTKSEYESLLAKNAGQKSKLTFIGIDTERLTNQNIQSVVTLTSPINGFVMAVNVNIGMYVNPTDVMFRIVDTEHLHAELIVFEKDVLKIKAGQKVRFTLSNEYTERLATVYLIGREIDKDRTVRVHCHLDREDPDLLPGMYLKAYVETGTQPVPAVPDKAVVGFEGKDYVVVKEQGNRFRLVQIRKGISELGYTQIDEQKGITGKTEIVINGAYDILAKMKNNLKED